MSYNSGKITAPVSVHDVQQALGSNSPDVGTLCENELVRKWAKYKPIKFAKIELLTAQNLVTANYGITDIPTWTRLSYMSTFLFSDSRGTLSSVYWPECDISKGSLSLEYWAHDKPTGGSSSPYRLADFSDYYHNAEAPIGPMPSTSIVIDPTGTLRVRFTMGAQSNYTLKLSDLTWPGSTNWPIGNMYFGVLMKQLTGSLSSGTYVATQKNGDADITMSQALQYGYWVEFSSSFVSASFAGTWKIFPIISNIPIAETSSISQQDGNKFIAPLPYHDQTITIAIEYAELLFTSAHGYKDANSQQHTATFVFGIQSPETTAGIVRNFRVTVTLCDSNGNTLTGYTGGQSTGQITTNASGTAAASISVQTYIAQIWSSSIYFKAEIEVTDTLKFKRTNYWALTGPIQVETPSIT